MIYNTVMKESYRIVIDTNVFIAALISKRGTSHKLVQMIGSKVFAICISVPLIFEYEDVAKRSGKVNLSHELIDDIIDYICAEGLETEIFYLWRPILTDPKDDFILELAVNAQADFIVTYNRKDFKGSEKFGVQVVSPREFLERIGESLWVH